MKLKLELVNIVMYYFFVIISCLSEGIEVVENWV